MSHYYKHKKMINVCLHNIVELYMILITIKKNNSFKTFCLCHNLLNYTVDTCTS